LTAPDSTTRKYFAQFGEDRILDAIFRHRREGNCVEVGANDGITDSMTYHFELMGWRCLLVEPIPDLAKKIMENRNCTVINCAASSTEGTASFFVAEEALGMSGLDLTRDQRKQISRAGGILKEIKVRKKPLDAILEESNFGRIDFISIDVEGHELEVLKGFSLERYPPRILLIEDNSNQTDPSVQDYLKSKGYEIFKRTGVNDWYALENDKEQVKAFQEERTKAFLENKMALRFSFLASNIPGWARLVPKMCIRLISSALYRFRKGRTASDQPGEGSH
jgi:FkbM family methyltransferase